MASILASSPSENFASFDASALVGRRNADASFNIHLLKEWCKVSRNSYLLGCCWNTCIDGVHRLRSEFNTCKSECVWKVTNSLRHVCWMTWNVSESLRKKYSWERLQSTWTHRTYLRDLIHDSYAATFWFCCFGRSRLLLIICLLAEFLPFYAHGAEVRIEMKVDEGGVDTRVKERQSKYNEWMESNGTNDCELTCIRAKSWSSVVAM